MFSMITNIYNKKTKGLTLFFLTQLEMFDVCTTGDMAHIDTIFKFLPHTHQHVDVCVGHPWCTLRTSLVVKKYFFSFPVVVKNSIKIGPLVFLL